MFYQATTSNLTFVPSAAVLNLNGEAYYFRTRKFKPLYSWYCWVSLSQLEPWAAAGCVTKNFNQLAAAVKIWSAKVSRQQYDHVNTYKIMFFQISNIYFSLFSLTVIKGKKKLPLEFNSPPQRSELCIIKT